MGLPGCALRADGWRHIARSAVIALRTVEAAFLRCLSSASPESIRSIISWTTS